ncbi:carboxylating nicotinate-nucleotide diphosphorylase [Mesorhizobium sp.]|uniref:carboxylating nicotinate-nucleotide diphosphorylase n=1 Tax=Mesorhizobium sp. TaxID=1871066 RepID=UPI000FE3E0FD|nr:carboxylating nicotinate-nucleotide diphosphorylase [Mesorhizobium sp.]RWK01320.1 MAG: carboxylating nicotinate-nucleotide diphosphorylase [Mesorhizobium sp.]
MTLTPLPRVMVEPLVRAALLEDLGRAGDLTTDAIVPADASATMVLATRQQGVIAGMDVATLAFELIDPRVDVAIIHPDGAAISAGDVIATVRGPARALLTAERTALNLLCHLSGIATQTAAVVDAVRDHKAKIVCTRKTTPGLRALEKYAVRAGGGANHRFGLDDAVLIKDNHIAIAGDVRTAIERARTRAGHMVKIEVEVDTLEQLDIALAAGADAVLLDNMSIEQLSQAVAMVAGRAITEASGRVTAQAARAIAATGVDLISAGWITHSAPILDIGLDCR